MDICLLWVLRAVSASGWSLIQRNHTDCGASLCVIYKSREWEALAHWRPLCQKKERNIPPTSSSCFPPFLDTSAIPSSQVFVTFHTKALLGFPSPPYSVGVLSLCFGVIRYCIPSLFCKFFPNSVDRTMKFLKRYTISRVASFGHAFKFHGHIIAIYVA